MRIDVHRTLAVTILLVSVRGFADHDLLTPLNINTQVPLAGVSVECARFFNLGGWGDGAWDGGRPHQLHVTSIDSNCNATVLYGYGGWNRDGSGNWLSLSAQIHGVRLVVLIPEHDAVATYVLSDDGETLSGVWEKLDESVTAFVSLRRL